MESKRRTLVKALTWRFCATSITFIVVLILTGEIVFAVEIGLIDTTIKFVGYYLHERTWLKISYGRYDDSPDYQI